MSILIVSDSNYGTKQAQLVMIIACKTLGEEADNIIDQVVTSNLSHKIITFLRDKAGNFKEEKLQLVRELI